MAPRTAIAHLERARAGIRRALAQWDAAGPAQLENSRQLLAAAAGDLRLFESAVRGGGVRPRWSPTRGRPGYGRPAAGRRASSRSSGARRPAAGAAAAGRTRRTPA